MKPVSYVTSFRQLKVMDPISGHVELIPGVNISNDPAIKEKLLTTEFATVAGVLEAQDLLKASNLVFGEFDVGDMGELPPKDFMLVILAWLDRLLENAWLIKDHAMTCESVFLRVELASGVSWSSNFLAIRTSFADGFANRDIEMSLTELKEWGQTIDLVEGYLYEKDSSSLRFMMEKGYTRSGRAMRFVAAARRTQDIAFKIANYCSALETLFTTESTELAHKLAERVAFFLGERRHVRRKIFATIKSAYGVRSKLVHGDTLKPSQIDGLPSLSAQCDIYLRTIVREIFSSEDLKGIFDTHQNEVLENYFANLILGPSEQITEE